MKELVLASSNVSKLNELNTLLSDTNYILQLQGDFDITSPEETGATFVENAFIKARHAAKVTDLPALADDSGLCVPALGGMPGVFSARYASRCSQENNQKLLESMHMVPDRRSYFVCVLVALEHADDPDPIIVSARWWGQIVQAPSGTNGFGYDPIFWVPELKGTVAQLTPEEKNKRSHRGRAVQGLINELSLRWG